MKLGCGVARGAALALLVVAGAQGAPDGEVRVVKAYATAMPPGARTAAAYLTIENRGRVADRLVAARSPAAAAVELHAMTMEGGLMRMRALTEVDVPARGNVRFAPGGLHLMIVDPKMPLREHDRFPLTLTFARAGALDVQVEVEALGVSHVR